MLDRSWALRRLLVGRTERAGCAGARRAAADRDAQPVRVRLRTDRRRRPAGILLEEGGSVTPTLNANDFAASTWLVRQAEREAMFAGKPLPSTTPDFFAALEDSGTTLITGEHDVFGDGTVLIIPTPGHTPGHQSLFLKLAQTGPIVLSGDLYHYPEERSLNRIPTADNAAETGASRVALEAFLKKSGAELWIQHDAVRFNTLKKSPAFYE